MTVGASWPPGKTASGRRATSDTMDLRRGGSPVDCKRLTRNGKSALPAEPLSPAPRSVHGRPTDPLKISDPSRKTTSNMTMF